MSSKNDGQKDGVLPLVNGAALRRRAEEKARAKGAQDLGSLSTEESGRLLHELQVHQIELEMQNEELRRAQEALEASRARYFDLYDLAPVGYLTLSERSMILEANLTSAALLGLPKSLLSKTPLTRYILPDDQSIYYLHRKRLFEEGEPQVFEIRMTRLDGTQFWARVEARVAQDEESGAPVCRAVMSDVTARKLEEEALSEALAKTRQRESEIQDHARKLQETNNELDRFAYTISHDLRAPLRTINGFVRLLADDYGPSLEEEAKRRLAVIEKNTVKMDLLIDDLLAFSRASRAAMNVTRIDMNRLVADVVEQLKSLHGPKAGIHVAALPDARGDPALIRQVLVNLIENAMKFSRNRPEPSIEVGSLERDGERIYFVKDNGVGFDMKHYDRLFGVFHRLVSEKEFEGTGVGLAIVHRLVTRHGGKVWAEAGPGEGATFFFTLSRRSRTMCEEAARSREVELLERKPGLPKT